MPLGPTSYGDSPYQSFSSFAGNPYFIDLDLLVKDKLLTRVEVNACDWGDDPRYVDYGKIYASRFTLLEKAKMRGFTRDREAVTAFERENERWLPNYALFMALKRHFGMKSWTEWDDEDIRCRTSGEVIERYRAELREDVELFTYIQFLFFRQWEALKAYIHSLGIRIIGDLPIYVAMDSATCGQNPKCSSWTRAPTLPTEAPASRLTASARTGRLWGNPLYNYEAMAKDGFGWWIRRIGGAQIIGVPRVRCSSRPPFSTSSCPVCSPVCPSPASISPRSATAACAWNAKSARSPSAPSGKSDTRPKSMKGSLSSESASLFMRTERRRCCNSGPRAASPSSAFPGGASWRRRIVQRVIAAEQDAILRMLAEDGLEKIGLDERGTA